MGNKNSNEKIKNENKKVKGGNNNYKKLIPDKMEITAKLFFHERTSGRYNSSKIFFRNIKKGESYIFKEHEYVEVYINNSFVFEGVYPALAAFNSITEDISKIKKEFDKKYITILEKKLEPENSKSIRYKILKGKGNNNYFIFLGNEDQLFCVTDSLRSIKELIKDDSEDFTYEITYPDNKKREFETMYECLEIFNFM